MRFINSLCLRVVLALYYLAMAFVSVLSPRLGRILIDDAADGMNARLGRDAPKVGDLR